MEGGIPCTNPNLELKLALLPLLQSCDGLFAEWYKQQHACNGRGQGCAYLNKERESNSHTSLERPRFERIMTFITRYTPAPGEEALLKHVDGAGKVDGSVVVALPIDRWSAPEDIHSFEGHGGGLTFWDGRDSNGNPQEIYYATRSGDIAFIDR